MAERRGPCALARLARGVLKVSRGRNLLLTHLPKAEFALLEPHLQPVELPFMAPLEAANEPIETIYFLESGFASVVADGGRFDLEVGIIGREGMTGLAVVLGQGTARYNTYMQTAGSGRRMSVPKLRTAIGKSAGLHRSLLPCAHAFLLQIAETALANGRSRNEERLARWLLLADDRGDGGDIPLTHRLLGTMLGVQRPAVSFAVNSLQRKGYIKTRRGGIKLLDREGLIEFSAGAYADRKNG